MSQCLRLDPDLDSAPRRRWPAMEASAPDLKERNDPDMDVAAAAPAATTAPATTPPQPEQQPLVPAGYGTSQLVCKPWTFNNMREAASQLPLMGNKWSKVAGDFPAEELRLANAAWENDENAVYRQAVAEFCDRIRATFPLSLDMGKISDLRR
ncbi:uncharacterized protein AKAME5_000529100 [Lates japonicus]|uniref:Uncharacterized protein n=1 Tax=Lates japonicus TaxID=270547 RepID=A0AAD3MEQ8_LATJO|nr:uncharacterized protein AKAME5_000529100 [Lates japonicus]